jgi:hypothetical protein
MDYIKIALFGLLLLIVLSVLYKRVSKKHTNEPFIVHQPDIEQIAANKGLVFGYIPKTQDTADTDKDKNKIPNVLYSGDSVNIFSNNKYFGYSSKNQLLGNFLEKLGTFTPYTYESVKIYSSDSPVKYGTSNFQIGVKHAGEEYFLQFIKNTNTFYLTKKGSNFVFINSVDKNKETEVNYNDSVLIKCLDNSEYLLIYEEFIVSEKDKSSSFYIQKAEVVDVCANFNTNRVDRFMPQLLNQKQILDTQNKYKSEIQNHVNNLKVKKNRDIQKIQNNIKSLETKFNTIKTNTTRTN